MPSSIGVALSNEIVNILLRWWERQVESKDRLDVGGVNDTGVALVEKLEALESFSISPSLFESFEPVIADNMLDEGKVDRIALMELRV